MNDEYDTTFLCTYKQLDDDELYRIQFLQAFKRESWDDYEITRKTDILYDNVGLHFKTCYDILRSGNTRFNHLLLFMGNNLKDDNLFRILFSMDLFSETHRCICDIIRFGSPKKESFDDLLRCINS